MLYDPKWDKLAETKADPYTLDGLIGWLEKQPSHLIYCYTSVGSCLLAQFFRAQGYTQINLNPYWFWHGPDSTKQEYPAAFNEIALGEPRTYGSALERARAALSSTGVRTMTGSNLPPGVTDRMIDEAAGAFDEDDAPPTREEQEADAWEHWHQRAIKAEADRYKLIAALKDIEFVCDGKEDADDGHPNDAMKIMAVVRTALRMCGASRLARG
jgi:hypothetical protein